MHFNSFILMVFHEFASSYNHTWFIHLHHNQKSIKIQDFDTKGQNLCTLHLPKPHVSTHHRIQAKCIFTSVNFHYIADFSNPNEITTNYIQIHSHFMHFHIIHILSFNLIPKPINQYHFIYKWHNHHTQNRRKALHR